MRESKATKPGKRESGAREPSKEATSAGDDWANRSSEMHWPDGFTPADADLFWHNEISINAPCSTVWKHLTEVEKWPDWYSKSQNARILETGQLQKESRFEFDIFELHVNARVSECVTERRLGWFAEGTNFVAYNNWFLIPTPEGCHLVNEEVAKGQWAKEARKTDPNMMHNARDFWLSSLKSVSEK